MAETWKSVVGWENAYEVSNFGRVRTIPGTTTDHRPIRPRVRSLHRMPNGYMVLDLKRDGRKARRYVHRLVAVAFLGPPPEEAGTRPYVNHLNGKKDDNRPSNLEWCTARANARHAAKMGLRSTALTDADVRRIRRLYKSGETYQALGDAYGLSKVMIGTIIRGESYVYVEGHRDAAQRQRNVGRYHGLAKLDAEAVRAIRTRLDAGEVQRRIAEDFGVSAQTITNIKLGRVWNHVD